MTGDLVALAERVERATQGGHDLTADVYEALGYDVIRKPRRPGGIYWRYRGRGLLARGFISHWEVQQPFTTSLDAALSLVPEGHTVQLSDWDHPTLRERGPWQAIVLPFGARGAMQQFTFTNRCDHAATPALALVAAALRARAQESGR